MLVLLAIGVRILTITTYTIPIVLLPTATTVSVCITNTLVIVSCSVASSTSEGMIYTSCNYVPLYVYYPLLFLCWWCSPHRILTSYASYTYDEV